MGLREDHLYLYNLYNIGLKSYYKWDCLELFSRLTGIETVPFIEKFKWNFKNIQEIKTYAKGTYSNGYPREGVVIRSDSVPGKLFIEEP
jgi:hypothetical protein